MFLVFSSDTYLRYGTSIFHYQIFSTILNGKRRTKLGVLGNNSIAEELIKKERRVLEPQGFEGEWSGNRPFTG